MKKSRLAETRIASILKQADAGLAIRDICRQAAINVPTCYPWKSKYGGMEASDLKRVKELESENSRLERLYTDMARENAAMKDLIAKTARAGAAACGGAIPEAGTRPVATPVL